MGTPVKNQGQCGSCWAESATEQIESNHFLATGKLVELSPQQVTSCDTTTAGCGGGWTENAYDYVVKAGGIEPNSDYPYTSGNTQQTGKCKFKKSDVAVKITGCNQISYYESNPKDASESVMARAIASTPLSICGRYRFPNVLERHPRRQLRRLHQPLCADCRCWRGERHPLLESPQLLEHELGRGRLLPRAVRHQRLWHRLRRHHGQHRLSEGVSEGTGNKNTSSLLLLLLFFS